MTNDTLEPLERLWHDLDPGPVPLDAVAAAGQRHAGTRRRAFLAAVAASVVLAAGVGVVVGGPGGGTRDLPPSVGTALTTEVVSGVTPEVDALMDTTFSGPVATWDARRSALLYVTPFGYSSSCPPTAEAHTTSSGGVLLQVDSYAGGGVCTADAVRATVTVEGIDAPPRVITVDSDGKAMEVMVQNQAPFVRHGKPNQGLAVGESGPMMVTLHCGLEWVQMGDQIWRTLGDGPSPNDPSQVLIGTGTRTSTDTLVFTSPDHSGEIVFHLTRRAQPYVCY